MRLWLWLWHPHIHMLRYNLCSLWNISENESNECHRDIINLFCTAVGVATLKWEYLRCACNARTVHPTNTHMNALPLTPFQHSHTENGEDNCQVVSNPWQNMKRRESDWQSVERCKSPWKWACSPHVVCHHQTNITYFNNKKFSAWFFAPWTPWLFSQI